MITKSNLELLLGNILKDSQRMLTNLLKANELDDQQLLRVYFFFKFNSNNNPYAMTILAYMHEKGICTPVNIQNAISFYDEAIRLGNSYAMSNRALMHRREIGGPQNIPEAIRLYDEAIRLDNDEAMSDRAYMHGRGIGGPVNTAEAISLYASSIIHGNKTAITNLERLSNQTGIPFDKEQMLHYIRSKLEPKYKLKALQDALDKNTPLGKFFRKRRGWKEPSEDRGTLLIIRNELDKMNQQEDNNGVLDSTFHSL